MRWQVCSGVNSMFARRVAAMFGLPYWGGNSPFVLKADALLFIGMFRHDWPVAQGYPKVPKVCMWVGSDVREYEMSPDRVFPAALHVTDSPWLVKRLHKRGFQHAMFVPLPVPLMEPPSTPEKPGVLLYLPHHAAMDVARTKALIKAAPDVPFYVMGHNLAVGQGFAPNLTAKGYVSGKEKVALYEKVNVFVRLMKYDGMSQTVAEMKTLGRHVFWSYMAPYCNWVPPNATAVEIAERLKDPALLEPDDEAAKWYRAVYAPEAFRDNMRRLCSWQGWDFPHEVA